MKINKFISVLLIVFVLMMIIGTVSAAEDNQTALGADDSNADVLTAGNSWYVKAGATGGDGSEDTPFGTLKEVTSNTNYAENDVIYMMNGTYKSTSNMGAGVVLKDGTTLKAYEGDSPIFDGQNVRQMFDFTANNIVMDGLTFINGKSQYGGMIDIEGNNAVIKNCVFDNGYGQYGGAIYIDPYKNIVIDNCTFTNCKASAMGGAIANAASGATISNCVFEKNTATYGAAIMTQKQCNIVGNEFKNGQSTYAGAILLYGNNARNVVIDNDKFTKNTAQMGGAIMYYSSANTGNVISNCEFRENKVSNPKDTTGNYLGGAIYIAAPNNRIVNSTFNTNRAEYSQDDEMDDTSYKFYGGSVYGTSAAVNTTVDNCSFVGGYADSVGGAIYLISENNTIGNSYFRQNNAVLSGGAIMIDRSNNLIENSSFDRNVAGRGGAIYYGVQLKEIANQTVNNCNFTGNGMKDTKGGAIYSWSYNTTVTNSLFKDNIGMNGGAIIYEKGPNFLENDTFIGNTATKYGGGAISSAQYGDTINNCTFEDNTAKGYGGAVSSDYPDIANSTFINNNANHGGAIFTIKANVTNSVFEDNTADDNYVILAATKVNENSNTRPGQEAVSFNHNEFLGIDFDKETEIPTVNGWYLYCVEELADVPDHGIMWEDLRFLQNSLTEDYVGDYLKILVVKFWNHGNSYDSIKEQINIFTDHDYLNSDDEMVKEVIALYDSGFRVPSSNAYKFYENGTISVFSFREILTPASSQNVFAFNETYVTPSMKIEKNVSKKVVKIGDEVVYTIKVTNTGDCNITGVSVKEMYPEGLKLISFKGKNWSKDTNNFVYNGILEAGKSVSFDVTFKVIKEGNWTNIVMLKSDVTPNETNNHTNNTTIVAHHPGLKVEKITLDPVVNVGEITSFEIIVTNTGDTDLGDVFVHEDSYDGLEYNSFYGENWKQKGDTFYYQGVLKPGESASFIVLFTTLTPGNFTNIVTAGSNSTNNTTTENKTEVIDNHTDYNKTNHTESNETNITNVHKVDTTRATGNPLLALLMVLLLGGMTSIRRFKK